MQTLTTKMEERVHRVQVTQLKRTVLVSPLLVCFFPYVSMVHSFNWKVVQLNITLNFEPLSNPKAH
jgi:hypothetical protein